MKFWVGVGAGAARSIECPRLLPSLAVDQGEEIAPDSARLRGHDALGCCGSDRRVHGVSPGDEHTPGRI